MTTLSDQSAFTVLSRAFKGPGTKIFTSHLAKRAYVSVFVQACFNLDADEDFVDVPAGNQQQNSVKFRVVIGSNSTALHYTMPMNENHMVMRNIPVDPWQEIWVSTSCPNKFCVYTHVSKKPSFK